jgi:FkbM family methyltransferase
MIKKVVVRSKQVIKYFLVNLILSLKITKKIYLPKISSAIHLRPQSSDLPTFHQIFTFKEYDMRIGFDPHFIIDAGANIGLAAVFFANKYPNAKIIAIEPEKSNFEMLEKNSKNYKNIFLCKRALSNQSDFILNVVDKGFGNWGFVTEIEDSTASTNIIDSVKTITIEEIVRENNVEYIDLLKIDIESGEKELFESNYEYWLPKTRFLIIELHDGIKMGSSKSFFKAISHYDFSYHNRGENLLFINRNIQ